MEKKKLIEWRDQLLDAQERTARQLEHIKALLDDFPEESLQVTRSGRQSRTSLQNEEAATTAFEILQEVGESLHRSDLFQRVVDRGFGFGGVNPENTFGAILSRDPRFKTAGRKGWWDLVETGETGKPKAEDAFHSLLGDAAVTER